MGFANCIECDSLTAGNQAMDLKLMTRVHTWTSKSGKFTVKVELLSFDQGRVSLRRDNGKTIKVPRAKLSKQDQKYEPSGLLLLVLAVGCLAATRGRSCRS